MNLQAMPLHFWYGTRIVAKSEKEKVMKEKMAKKKNGDKELEMSEEVRERVARRARELWEASGCAQGNDLGNWLAAEREVLNARQAGRRAQAKG